MLVVSGQIERDLIGADRGILHEVNDQQDCIRPITKYVRRMMTAEEAPEAVHEAFRQLTTGRPRPVEIEMPPETMAEQKEVTLIEAEGYPRPAASDEQVAEAARILAGARRPLIWAGGGVISSEGSEALVRLAERLQAPVITTAEGKGVIDDRHPLALGALRLRNDPVAKDRAPLRRHPGRGQPHGLPHVAGRPARGADRHRPRRAGPQLGEHLRRGRRRPHRDGAGGRQAGRDHRHGLPPVLCRRDRGPAPASQGVALRPEPQESYLQAVRSAVPEDGILVSGMTQLGYYARAFWPTYEPRTFITSSYSGNLGYAYPTALGAKVAQPDRPVVALCGDGGFLFNSQELATAVQHGINAVAVVFNDNAYGNVLRDQVNQFNGRAVGAELHNPDFVKLAEAYGVRAARAEGPEALESALREALAADAPSLIEVPVGMMPTPFT